MAYHSDNIEEEEEEDDDYISYASVTDTDLTQVSREDEYTDEMSIPSDDK
ncbi:MAG: hypothetical protein ACYCOU_25190 [Sulfobacillus sp.]